jgi:hypothetical protein
MDPKWIKVGISVAGLVLAAVTGGAVGVNQTKNYRLENETAMKAEITKLKGDLKACRNASIDVDYEVSRKKMKCWTRKVLD